MGSRVFCGYHYNSTRKHAYRYSGECGKADKGHCFRPCMLAVNVSVVVVDTGRLLFMVF